MWGVILALQTSRAVHLGVDNLGVVRHVGRLLDGRHGPAPFELVKDGDLLLLIERMLQLRVLGTVRVTEVKGHAEEDMVRDGGVSELVRLGNADDAADFGRRRVDFLVFDARRNLSGVCGRWYPVVLTVHRFFILLFLGLWLITMGVMARLLIRWSGLLVLFPRGVSWCVPCGIVLFCLGPQASGRVSGSHLLLHLSLLMVLGAWPFSVGILVKWVAFLGSFHWPATGADLGFGRVSFVEILILYELCSGERLVLEKAVPRYRRPGRPISVSAVLFGPGTDIGRSCWVSCGALFGALSALPGGIGRFMPCDVGANRCRLRHIGWEKCGRGVTSGPGESASEGFLDDLLLLFRYPPRSAAALLGGTLPLRY